MLRRLVDQLRSIISVMTLIPTVGRSFDGEVSSHDRKNFLTVVFCIYCIRHIVVKVVCNWMMTPFVGICFTPQSICIMSVHLIDRVKRRTSNVK
jgi:hypothetical protein